MPPSVPVVAVVGPTATGKSELAVLLARALDGEVVNADASQLYRGMDIGTAKLGTAERAGVPHHLLDVLDVTQEASVAVFQREARRILDEITDRGRCPVLVGGSGLYVRAALDRLEFPPTDAATRERLEAEAAERGSWALHERLSRLDPGAATAILPANARRVVRALEVIELTGRSFSATMPTHEYVRPAVQVGLRLDRAEIDARIAARVDGMLAAGLLDEVRHLVARGLREGRTACRALGYAQLLRHLDGEWSLGRARDETVRATRKFARRQESWFRRDPRVHWVDAVRRGEPGRPEHTPDQVLQATLAVVGQCGW